MKKNKKPNYSFEVSIDYSTGKKISNLITEYNARILYLGLNRNGSFLTKSVVEDMCKTIGGIPVVGQYDEGKEDFLGHGDLKISISENGDFVEENVGPVPYGFVPTQPKIWWETVKEDDGKEVEYLCTNAYLWTGRYKELEKLENGKNNQSMELDPKTSTGSWVIDEQKKIEYFKFDKVEIIGLCILGEDVEPCFESASFYPNFSTNINFSQKLAQMKQELQDALEEKGTAEELNSEPTVEELENIEKEETINELEDPENFNDLAGSTEIQDYEKLSQDYEELKNNYEALKELNEDFISLTEKYNALEQDYNTIKEELQEYKNSELKEEKLEKLNEYSDFLSKEDFENFKNNIDNFTLEDLEVQAERAGYKNMKNLFSLRKKKNSNIENSSYTSLEDGTPKNLSFTWVDAVLKNKKDKEDC